MKTTLQQEPAKATAEPRPEPVPQQMPNRLRADVLPLAMIVTAGFAFIAAWSLRVTDWGVMPDELLYAKLSLVSGFPSVRGHSYGHYTPLYPLSVSPAFQLFDVPAAFRVAHGINAFLMASVAVPTYLLGRAIALPRLTAYCAASLSVVVPWVVFANFLMTESLAYPAFIFAVWGIVRATQSASPGRDLAALVLIGLATLTRTQFIALAAVLPAVVLLHELTYPRLASSAGKGHWPSLADLRSVARRHWLLVVGAAIGAVVVVAFALTGGADRLLGAYTGTLHGTVFPNGTSRSFRGHLALLGLGIGVVPLMLAIAFGVAAAVRPVSKAEHGFAIALGLATPILVLEAASVNLRTIDLVQERYVMFLAPLLFVAATAFIIRPRLVLASLGIALVVSAWFGMKLDYALDRSFSLAWPFQRWLERRAEGIGDLVGRGSVTPGDLLPIFLVVTALFVFLALRYLPRRAVMLGFTALVLGFCAAQTQYNFSRVTIMTEPRDRIAPKTDLSADWIDQSLPSGATAAAIPGVIGAFPRTRLTWWDVEFWNKSVDRVYDYAPGWLDTPFKNDPMTLNWKSGALKTDRGLEYAVVPRQDRRFRPAGRPLAQTAWLELIEVVQPPAAAWAVRGTDSDGWTGPGAPAYLHLFPDGFVRPTRVTAKVQLTSAPTSRSEQHFSLEGGLDTVRGRVRPDRIMEVSVPACVDPDGGTRISLHVRESVKLPSGKRAGVAVTGVRTERGGRCDRT